MVVSVGQCVTMDGVDSTQNSISVWLSLVGRVQCDLGLLVLGDSRCVWICSVWVFASRVIRSEGQGAARFGWSVCAWGSVGYVEVHLEGLGCG